MALLTERLVQEEKTSPPPAFPIQILCFNPLRFARFRSKAPMAGGDCLDEIVQWWDNPTMIVTLDSKRRLSIPVSLAPASAGDQFDATFDAEEDTVILRRVKRKSNWLEIWKKCPVPMDDFPPRSRELPKKLKL